MIPRLRLGCRRSNTGEDEKRDGKQKSKANHGVRTVQGIVVVALSFGPGWYEARSRRGGGQGGALCATLETTAVVCPLSSTFGPLKTNPTLTIQCFVHKTEVEGRKGSKLDPETTPLKCFVMRPDHPPIRLPLGLYLPPP